MTRCSPGEEANGDAEQPSPALVGQLLPVLRVRRVVELPRAPHPLEGLLVLPVDRPGHHLAREVELALVAVAPVRLGQMLRHGSLLFGRLVPSPVTVGHRGHAALLLTVALARRAPHRDRVRGHGMAARRAAGSLGCEGPSGVGPGLRDRSRARASSQGARDQGAPRQATRARGGQRAPLPRRLVGAGLELARGDPAREPRAAARPRSRGSRTRREPRRETGRHARLPRVHEREARRLLRVARAARRGRASRRCAPRRRSSALISAGIASRRTSSASRTGSGTGGSSRVMPIASSPPRNGTRSCSTGSAAAPPFPWKPRPPTGSCARARATSGSIRSRPARSHRRSDGVAEVGLSGPDGAWRVRVRRDEAAEPRPVSCGEEKIERPAVWSLVAIEPAS